MPREGYTTITIDTSVVERLEELNEEIWDGHRAKSDMAREALREWMDRMAAEEDVEDALDGD